MIAPQRRRIRGRRDAWIRSLPDPAIAQAEYHAAQGTSIGLELNVCDLVSSLYGHRPWGRPLLRYSIGSQSDTRLGPPDDLLGASYGSLP